MWDKIWFDANLVTCRDGQLNIIRNGAIAVEQGRIAWLGSLTELQDQQAQQMESIAGKWITPGLIDCHTHLIYGGQRANEFAKRMQGVDYATIALEGGGIKNTVSATREASHEQLYQQASKRLKAMLAQGVTTIEIKSGYGLDLATEMKMLEVAGQLADNFPVTIKRTLLAAHCVPVEYKDRSDDYIDFLCNELIPQVAEAGLADAVDGFCESIAFSTEQISKVFDAAQQYQLPVKLHAEQLTHMGASSLAAKYKALSADHLEYAELADAQAMQQAGTCAVLLPGAYYYLREIKKPPVQLLTKHNVPIAIATDCNPGSSPSCSLLLIMNMACVLFDLTPEQAILGTTYNAAQALGIEHSHGSLAVDKQADFVIWDIEDPMELVAGMGNNYCQQIIKAGKEISL